MSLLDMVNRSTGTVLISIGSWPSAATASTWSAIPVLCNISAIAGMGCTVPISLLAQLSETRIVSSVMRARSLSRLIRPNWSGAP